MTQEERLARALEEFLAAAESGESPRADDWLARYPDLADELRPALAALDFMHAPEEPEAGRTLGDFRLVREVGRGGMGVVYEAKQRSLDRRVALKVLPFASVLDERQIQRFRHEAQAAALLHHTNIVPVHAVGHDRGVHFYAMQFVEGPTLADVIGELRGIAEKKNGKPHSAALDAITKDGSSHSEAYCRAVARLGAQAGEALDHAHQHGVVHRDVKPGNLMVDASGHLWITDFGLARSRVDNGLTVTGDLIGTLRYMSPEQARAGTMPVDHRTDVYSLGATLYEALTLEPAFPGDEAHAVLDAIATRDPVPVRRHNPSVPAALETIVVKALEKDPGARYATAAEMAADLQRFLEHKPILARPPSLLDRATKWARRHRAVVTASFVTLLLAVVGLAASTFLIAREQNQTQQALETARRNFDHAIEAVDALVKVGSEELADDPFMTGVQKRLLERALDFYELFRAESPADPALRLRHAQAHRKAGEILGLLGRGDESRTALESALALLDSEADDVRRERATVLMLQARILLANGDLSGARELADRTLARQQALADETRRVEDRLGLGRALILRGAIHNLEGKREDGLVVQRHGVRMLEDVVAVDDRPAHVEALAVSLHELGLLVMNDPSPVEAERCFRRVLMLKAEPQTIANAHHDLSFVLARTKRTEEALTEARRAVEILDELVEEFPHRAVFLDRLARSYNSLGIGLATSGRMQEAGTVFRKAVTTHESLIERSPTSQVRFGLTSYLRNLGLWHLSQQQIEEALKVFEHSLETVETVMAEGADSRESREERPAFLAREGHAVAVASRIPNYRNTLFGLLNTVGDLRARLGDASGARDCFEKQMNLEPESHTAHKSLAVLLAVAADPQVRDSHNALRAAEQAVVLAPDGVECHFALGLALYRVGDYTGAIEAIERALKLGKADFVRFVLALAHWKLGDSDKARNAYAQALAWMETKDGNWVSRALRDEASELLGNAR